MKPYEATNMQELIEAIKEDRGWKSTRDAAQGMGISHTMVARFENGETTQDRDVLLALARAARLKPVRILEISGFLERESPYPPDIQAILDMLQQNEKSNPKLAAALKRIIYAELAEALDLPADILGQENN